MRQQNKVQPTTNREQSSSLELPRCEGGRQVQRSQLFEERKVRTLWDDEQEKWYFSIVDVIEVLTDTDRPRKYWNDLKKKLHLEGSELSEKIGQLKMLAADGKMRITDVADTEQLFRLIQSIPSPKAEPISFLQIKLVTL